MRTSLVGVLKPGNVIGGLARNRRGAARSAFMWRSSQTLPVVTDWKNQPIQYFDAEGNAATMAQPTGPYIGADADTAFFTALGQIHVFGHSGSAFGIDFSVIQNIHASPVRLEQPAAAS